MLKNKDKKKYTKRRVHTENFFDYEFNEDQISAPILEEDILHFITKDNALKFYNLFWVDLQEEDYESLMIKISSTVSHKKRGIQRH